MTRSEIVHAIETVRATLDRLQRVASENDVHIMHTRQYLALLENMID